MLRDPEGYNNGGTTMWESGWLPAIFQGTEIQSASAAVLDLHPAVTLPDGVQHNNLEALARLNEERRRLYPHESDLDARIRNYELAARMQLSAEGVLRIDRRDRGNPSALRTGRSYHRELRDALPDGPAPGRVRCPVRPGDGPGEVGRHTRGTITRRSSPVWRRSVPQVDRPTAGLIRDLRMRGLLDSTIVLWTGEFGRLPISQKGDGRDHNRNAFSLLLAGGGFKAGHVHGRTDEFSYAAEEGKMSCPDLLATILHQLGIDHDRLKYLHHGREESLTDSPVTHAHVVHDILDAPAPERA